MGDENFGSGGGNVLYSQLRREILNLTLSPSSTLDEGSISARFNVSRTPVREALIKLAAEGLVTNVKGRGARVAALDLQNLRAFFEGLEILQRAVTRLAAIRRTSDDLEAIEARLVAFESGAAALDSEVVNEANYDFHKAIAQAAHSDFLASAYERCLGEGLRIGYVCFSEHTGVDERLDTHLESTMADHRRMFFAIQSMDGDEAERLASSHAILFRSRVMTALFSTDVAERVSVLLKT